MRRLQFRLLRADEFLLMAKSRRKSEKKGTRSPNKRPRLVRSVDTRIVYCGDNLDVLARIPAGSVDLIYIDPPFHSGRDYQEVWGEEWERRAFTDRHESMDAYIEYMRTRCSELARVLSPTGSFYYHCDWHASHYVKAMLDAIFGISTFRAEIIWRRQNAKGLASRAFANNHDTILYYARDNYTFNRQYRPHDPAYLEKSYKHAEPETGRRYTLSDLTNPNKDRPNLTYEWNGVTRVWRWTKKRMEEADRKGLLHYSKSGLPRQKRYLDEMEGLPVDTVWDDIQPVQSRSRERIGYPTQKPLALLDRIIQTSSNPGDVVLDAFCGCGTTLESAELSGRQWIGIDFSPTACKVMASRLEDRCKIRCNESLWKADRGFIVRGVPMTLGQLREMDPFDFQNWAIIAIDGHPNRKLVGDFGIDGRLYPAASILSGLKGASGKQMEFTEDLYFPIQAKQKKAGRQDIDLFETAMRRVDANCGYFVAFGYTRGAIDEIKRFERVEGREINYLTVEEILQQQEQGRIQKLAR